MIRVALFDYGAGNLHSLGKALEAGGASVEVTRDWDEALGRDALVLPGVGSFGAAVRSLGESRDRIRGALESGYPCLGICLGMQLLFDTSEEGDGTGVGFIHGSVLRLQADIVPQMGWNDVGLSSDPVFNGLDSLVAYYANSYVCAPTDPSTVIASTVYQGEAFPAGVRKKNSWGMQFHPEKSSGAGLRLIRNFLEEIA